MRLKNFSDIERAFLKFRIMKLASTGRFINEIYEVLMGLNFEKAYIRDCIWSLMDESYLVIKEENKCFAIRNYPSF